MRIKNSAKPISFHFVLKRHFTLPLKWKTRGKNPVVQLMNAVNEIMPLTPDNQRCIRKVNYPDAPWSINFGRVIPALE